jgi:hypothetical protein
MKETNQFIVNGRDHGTASLGEYRRDISAFSDLTEHRLNTAEQGARCSKTANCQCGARSAPSSRQRSLQPQRDLVDHRETESRLFNANEFETDHPTTVTGPTHRGSPPTSNMMNEVGSHALKDGVPPHLFGDWKYQNYCFKPSRKEKIEDAYRKAYWRVRAAEIEINQVSYIHRAAYWNQYEQHPESRLADWFGASTAPHFEERFNKVREVLGKLSWRYRHGFWWYHSPVIIRCKLLGWGETPAWHFAVNQIALMPSWFDDFDATHRTITMMHEMGHYSLGDAGHLRDESHDTCHSPHLKGKRKHKCYRGSLTDQNTFNSGNPFHLAVQFNLTESSEIMDIMLNNVDNYTCYMWNRWEDRGSTYLDFNVDEH